MMSCHLMTHLLSILVLVLVKVKLRFHPHSNIPTPEKYGRGTSVHTVQGKIHIKGGNSGLCSARALVRELNSERNID